MRTRDHRIWLVFVLVLGSLACAKGAYDIFVEAFIRGEFCPMPANSRASNEAIMMHCEASDQLDRFIIGFLASVLIAVSSLVWIWLRPKH